MALQTLCKMKIERFSYVKIGRFWCFTCLKGLFWLCCTNFFEPTTCCNCLSERRSRSRRTLSKIKSVALRNSYSRAAKKEGILYPVVSKLLFQGWEKLTLQLVNGLWAKCWKVNFYEALFCFWILNCDDKLGKTQKNRGQFVGRFCKCVPIAFWLRICKVFMFQGQPLALQIRLGGFYLSFQTGFLVPIKVLLVAADIAAQVIDSSLVDIPQIPVTIAIIITIRR